MHLKHTYEIMPVVDDRSSVGIWMPLRIEKCAALWFPARTQQTSTPSLTGLWSILNQKVKNFGNQIRKVRIAIFLCLFRGWVCQTYCRLGVFGLSSYIVFGLSLPKLCHACFVVVVSILIRQFKYMFYKFFFLSIWGLIYIVLSLDEAERFNESERTWLECLLHYGIRPHIRMWIIRSWTSNLCCSEVCDWF